MKKKLNKFVVYLWYYQYPKDDKIFPLFVQFPHWGLSREEKDVITIMKAKKTKVKMVVANIIL